MLMGQTCGRYATVVHTDRPSAHCQIGHDLGTYSSDREVNGYAHEPADKILDQTGSAGTDLSVLSLVNTVKEFAHTDHRQQNLFTPMAGSYLLVEIEPTSFVLDQRA